MGGLARYLRRSRNEVCMFQVLNGSRYSEVGNPVAQVQASIVPALFPIMAVKWTHRTLTISGSGTDRTVRAALLARSGRSLGC